MKTNKTKPVQQDTASTTRLATQSGKKKTWIDPEIRILSINDSTLGGVLINDDGVGFSS